MRVVTPVIVILVVGLFGCGGGGGGSPAPPSPPPPPPAPLSTGPETCTNGSAGDFSCSGISLSKRVSLETMGGTGGNDIWGWFDAQTGNEYALMGLTNGTAFVDVSSPEEPIFLGRLPTQTLGQMARESGPGVGGRIGRRIGGHARTVAATVRVASGSPKRQNVGGGPRDRRRAAPEAFIAGGDSKPWQI